MSKGTSSISGHLQRVFPGSAKQWQCYLNSLIEGYWDGYPSRQVVPTPENICALQKKRMPPFAGNDGPAKQCKKLGLDPYGDMTALATLLREAGVTRPYGSNTTDLRRNVAYNNNSLRGYRGSLSHVESLLAWSHEMVVVGNIPYGGSDGIHFRKGIMYKDEQETVRDKSSALQALLDSQASIARELLQEMDPRLDALRDDAVLMQAQYGAIPYEVRMSLINLYMPLASTDKVRDGILGKIKRYHKGVEALEILLQVIDEPHPSVATFDAKQAFIDQAPRIAASKGTCLRGLQGKDQLMAASMAQVLLEETV